MQQSIKSGLKTTGVLPGKLKLQRRAKALFEISIKKMNDRHIDGNRNKLMSYAFAVAEHNASGGIVVTAPTCGASGILPAVLRYAQEQLGISDNKIINALSIAGLIGNIARTNGSIAGAEAGCQAEVGVACAMAAGAYTYLLKLSNTQIFNSAADVLEHHLGLTCDPVLGYVQSPCIERNALASLRALDAVDLISLSSNKKTIFNYDDIIETMLETGKNMSKDYRETSQGGLASIYAKKIDNKFKEKFDIKIS
jgi:L-serine dehydratase